MMIVLQTVVTAALLGVSPRAEKVEAPPCAPPQAESADRCSVFFGSAAKRHANRLARRRRLRSVVARDHTIDITYSGAWREPTVLRPKKMRVVGTYSAEKCTPVALVQLDEPVGGCEAGTYALPADASLGPDAQVLAVVNDVVVIERLGELAYIASAGSPPPVFRMAWLAPFTIKRSGSGGSASAGKPPTPGRPATPAAKAAARRKKKRDQ